MKTRMLFLCALTTLAASTLPAQLPVDVKATIPFDFVAGTKHFGAGEYTVRSVQAGVLRISSKDRTKSAMMLVNLETKATPMKPSLRFHRYGGSYYLEQATAGGTEGVQLPNLDARKLHSSDRAANDTQPEVMVVALRR